MVQHIVMRGIIEGVLTDCLPPYRYIPGKIQKPTLCSQPADPALLSVETHLIAALLGRLSGGSMPQRIHTSCTSHPPDPHPPP